MLITVVAIVVMTRFAALIFSRAILRTGTRLRLRAVLRGDTSTTDVDPAVGIR
jgi:hypothetical protein